MTIVEEGVSSVYAAPGTRGAVAEYRSRYGHYIGGEWVEPHSGEYFENITPAPGEPFCEVARGDALRHRQGRGCRVEGVRDLEDDHAR